MDAGVHQRSPDDQPAVTEASGLTPGGRSWSDGLAPTYGQAIHPHISRLEPSHPDTDISVPSEEMAAILTT